MRVPLLWVGVLLLSTPAVRAQSPWYQRFTLRGYTQLRYEQVHTLDAPAEWKSAGFMIRRGRLTLSGFVTDNVFMYIQPDFAASSGSALNVLQLRDAYFDVFLDSLHTYRLRVGLSKVPFSYESMQSSSLRPPMERAEVVDAASVPGQRDLGIFAMWAPPNARAVYERLTRDGFKGSGDYGCISIGIYNGQGLNRPELDHTLYWSARATYPLELGNMVVEPALQAFTGLFTPQTSSTVQAESNALRDERYAATLAISPAPIGVLAEYVWGTAPRYVPPWNGGGGYVRSGRIEGGFVTLYATTRIMGYSLVPFVRWQTFHGGIKSQIDAPMTDLGQWEAGAEWQISSTLKLTAEYMHTSRHTLTSSGSQQTRSESVWLQLQISY
ncbi:MAG: porin [Candidatus Kapaibacterium sp.]|nr:MAG: porin [Candidatus Kapabacteria bacterium]